MQCNPRLGGSDPDSDSQPEAQVPGNTPGQG